ncbi:hypothetical protein PoB_003054400 [Plakobranchus ocellatus]|uniref:Uncharacterized protein n=1 Tax=Plakobranchus ocellatus TaxID=259542 RepID=A0AAV4A8S5_9GAST|nr:hypothetical protein PoB_003054400 [Plakobranchus ocellatus]
MNDKRRVEEEKAKDKKEAKERNGTVVICMDLQGVLLAPSINASSTYFKTKLAVHNFILYNMVTKDAACYIWHEAEDGLTSNEFTSCIVDHLTSLSGANKIVLYSDGCVYQKQKFCTGQCTICIFPYSEIVKFNRNTLLKVKLIWR